MRIQHNITALNAHRNLSNNNSAVGKNLEKLSSGFRINRAGDDAAGLAISEKMRAQITGLQTAQKNAEDGVSLVQTAEGALTEVHSMLNRMVELATQAANGTYSEANRQEMQKEITALNSEIDRISNTSNFNGTNLFGGAGGAVKLYDAKDVMIKGTPVTGKPQTASASKYTSGDWTEANTGGTTDGKFTITVESPTGPHDVEITLTEDETQMDAATLANNLNAREDLKIYGIKVTAQGKKLEFTSEDMGSEAAHVSNVKYNKTATANGQLGTGGALVKGKDKGNSYDLSQAMQTNDKLTVNGKTYTFAAGAQGDDGATFHDVASLKTALEKNGMTLEDVSTAKNNSEVVFKEAKDPNGKDGVSITLHVGESSSEANGIVVNIKSMSTKSLGIDKVDITKAATAKEAIDTINSAIDTVSSIRSDLGALQNRLEHTINNLGVQTENITAAESRIRDVDMAKEMMAYTKNNILVQASQAMLAQANQVPQGVLQLLQ